MVGQKTLRWELCRCPSGLHQRLAPGAGFEPATNRLTADCSTAELSGIARPSAYSKSGLLRKDRANPGGRGASRLARSAAPECRRRCRARLRRRARLC
jgi:hypothetical protein